MNDTESAGADSTKQRLVLVTLNYAPEQTGVAAYSTTVAEGLAAQGHDVSVIAAAPHHPGWRIRPDEEWAPTEQVNGVHITRLRSWIPSRLTYLTRTVFEVVYGLRFAARSFRDVDTVILVGPALFTCLVVRARLALIPSRPRMLLWMQEQSAVRVDEQAGTFTGLLDDISKSAERAVVRSCDRVVVGHERFKDYVVHELGARAERVTVIRNWATGSAFSHVDVAAVRQRHGWRPDETIVLHAGAMGARQDLTNVLMAALSADRMELPVRFVLLGDGSQRAILEEAGARCQRLQFIDPLPDEAVAEALAAADILLVNERPGRHEAAVASQLTGYFATGRPVMAGTDPMSATADEIRVSGAGILIPIGEPKALVDAVLRLREHPDAVDGAAGPSYVRERLSAPTAIRAFAAVVAGEQSTEHETAGV